MINARHSNCSECKENNSSKFKINDVSGRYSNKALFYVGLNKLVSTPVSVTRCLNDNLFVTFRHG